METANARLVTITAISRKQVQTRKGPSVSLSIKTQEFGEKWLSGWESPANSGWLKGMQVTVEVTQNGEYLNYKVPKVTEFPSFPNAKAVPTASPSGQAQSKAIELMERTNELLAKILGALNAKNGVISSEVEELTPDNEEALPF